VKIEILQKISQFFWDFLEYLTENQNQQKQL